MKNFSLKSVLLGGGIVVFVPLICYFILRGAGHTGHIEVPGNYGIDTVIEKTVDGKVVNDTVYHTIQPTQFISHLNDSIDLATAYPRKVLLINFFNTNNGDTSERLIYHMKHIQNGFKMKKTDSAIQLISVSTLTEQDDVATIRNYANINTHDHDTWTFLTGEQAEVNKLAQQELFLPETSNTSYGVPGEIVLIDKYRNIRGYYNGMDSMEVIRCIDDIATLMVEKNIIHEKKRK